jgi:hypothetical protein
MVYLIEEGLWVMKSFQGVKLKKVSFNYSHDLLNIYKWAILTLKFLKSSEVVPER